MLDKSVPYFDVLMRREGGVRIHDAALPAGYYIVTYSPGDEADWARIETAVGEFDDEQEALALFAKGYLPFAGELARRCLFAVNPQGEKVGTLTAWFATVDGETAPWLHWVGVHPKEQNRGLAKALIASGLRFFDALHPGKASYLHTQTWSHVAIRLYQRQGYAMLENGNPAGEPNQYRQAKYILDCVYGGDGRLTPEQLLNQPEPGDRLKALEGLSAASLEPLSDTYVNNHIHTIYSFSPYSPALAVYRARAAGLPTAGIMDHDSVSGALEFATAGERLGVATTTGLECRVSLKDTPFEDRLVNNPDQKGNAYLAMHGIPRRSLAAIREYLRPIRYVRDLRNREMTGKLNDVLAQVSVSVDYERDVRPISQWENGGSITERHICCAASNALLKQHDGALLDALGALGIFPAEKIAANLADEKNPYRMYDLLGVLKSDLVQRFYIPATAECPPIGDFVSLCHRSGAIAAYPYLGDVGQSVTGDKKMQAFEDAYLDELFVFLKELGFDAVTYMPSRNTARQLERVRKLCGRHGFFEISGEDINTPRQSFICPALERPEFAHLRVATWALIGHEKEASRSLEKGMFADAAKKRYPDLEERIKAYAALGR